MRLDSQTSPTPLARQTAPGSRLEIETRQRDPEVSVLALRGEVDIESAETLDSALGEIENSQTPACVVLDLTALEFIDSMGISVLVKAHRRAESSERRLVLNNPQPQIKRVFDISGITSRFTIT